MMMMPPFFTPGTKWSARLASPSRRKEDRMTRWQDEERSRWKDVKMTWWKYDKMVGWHGMTWWHGNMVTWYLPKYAKKMPKVAKSDDLMTWWHYDMIFIMDTCILVTCILDTSSWIHALRIHTNQRQRGRQGGKLCIGHTTWASEGRSQVAQRASSSTYSFSFGIANADSA